VDTSRKARLLEKLAQDKHPSLDELVNGTKTQQRDKRLASEVTKDLKGLDRYLKPRKRHKTLKELVEAPK